MIHVGYEDSDHWRKNKMLCVFLCNVATFISAESPKKHFIGFNKIRLKEYKDL